MVVKREKTSVKYLGNGMSRRVLNRGGKLMIVEFTFKKGGEGSVHSHPHEQIGNVVSGSGIFTLDGKKTEVAMGDSMYIPSNTPHGFKSYEENTVLMETFTPQRDDFLE